MAEKLGLVFYREIRKTILGILYLTLCASAYCFVLPGNYDSPNRVKSYIDANGNTIDYRYYKSGKIAKIIYPGGTEIGIGHVEYTYWKTGRLKQVIDKLNSTTTPRTTHFHWHDDGRLHRIVRPNNTERRIKYDAAGRPELVEEFTSTGQFIAIHKNSYYPSDEIKSIYQLPKSQTTAATPAPVTAMTHRSDNSLKTFETQTVTHDPDGNMTNGPLPNGTFGAYTYDIRNRLENAGGLAYNYDPEGERISTTGNGDNITYVNENNLGLSKVIQRTKNGATTRYVWGVGLLYEVNANGAATYYHYDNVGSTIAFTNDTEEVIERIEYAPFGKQTSRTRTEGHAGAFHDTPFLWTGFFGNQTDSNNLIYLRARYYNTLTRRFLNSDPARDGSNWYAYAGGNPMSFVDPTGLGINSALNAVQTSLSFLGLIPVIGNAFDIVNAGISVGRGNLGSAAFDLAAAIPGIGQAVTGTKLAAAGIGVAATTGRVTNRGGTVFIGKLQDLKGVSPNKTLLPDLPNLGSAKANFKQNSSVLRRKIREGSTIQDKSFFRKNIDIDPSNPNKTVGQSFLGAERLILDNKGLFPDANGIFRPKGLSINNIHYFMVTTGRTSIIAGYCKMEVDFT